MQPITIGPDVGEVFDVGPFHIVTKILREQTRAYPAYFRACPGDGLLRAIQFYVNFKISLDRPVWLARITTIHGH